MSARSERRRTRGTPVRVVAAKAKLETSTPEGQHGQVVSTDKRALREAIQAGKCPWCGNGPYRVLASHTYRRHGIDRYELRAMGGFARRQSICDPDLSQEIAERQRETAIRLGFIPPKKKVGSKLSAGGLESRKQFDQQRRKLRRDCVICGGEVPYKPSQPHLQTCGARCLAALRKQKSEGPRKDTCKRGHPLKGDNVILREVSDRDNAKRVCRSCERERRQRRHTASGERGGAS